VEELPAPLARFEIMSEGLGHWWADGARVWVLDIHVFVYVPSW
jgi:hypothetical protein